MKFNNWYIPIDFKKADETKTFDWFESMIIKFQQLAMDPNMERLMLNICSSNKHKAMEDSDAIMGASGYY